MKKILIIFLFLFLSIGVKAYTGDTMVIKNSVSNVYYYYNYNGKVYTGIANKIFAAGNLAYILDIKLGVNTNTYSSTYPKDIDEDIMLFAYFGYGYSNNISLDYYFATQQLIWEKLGFNVKFYTAINAGGNLISYEKYKEEIKEHVRKYKEGIKLDLNMNYILGSKNTIRGEGFGAYKIKNISENKIYMDKNNLYLEANVEGIYSFSLLREYKNNGYNRVFEANNSSPLLYVGNLNPEEHSYNYKVSAGTLTLINDYVYKNDCYKGENYEFIIYDEEKNGVRKFDSLFVENKILISDISQGNYILKRFMNNQFVDEYSFAINNDKKDEIIVLSNMLNKTNISLYTSYKNTKFGKDNNSSNYIKVLDENENVIQEIKTDDNGMANVLLYCGRYKIVKFDGEKIIDNYYLQESHFIKNEIINYSTVYYQSKVKIYIYNEKNELIKNLKILKDEKEYIVNSLGYAELDYLPFGIYDIFIDNQEYELSIDENSLFYVEMQDTYVDKKIFIKTNSESLETQELSDEVELVKDKEKKLENKNTYNIEEEFILPNLYAGFNIIFL